MTSPCSAPKKIVVLGSTGSIGCSTLKVAADMPESLEIIGLAGHQQVEKLAEQVRATRVKHVGIADAERAATLRGLIPADVVIHIGTEGLCELATLAEADTVLVAIVGTAGLEPTLQAIRSGKHIAIASKEILVMAGEIVTAAASKAGVNLLPVDSEHNAIFQCLDGHRGGEKEISRLILTASGGPFRHTAAAELPHVTVEQALKHPTWNMGKKITIDSATLFNKGLEMIEARWLFGIDMPRIDVVVHPQSIVHSMVEFIDGSVLAQMSHTDMCFPIQYALTWPERRRGGLRPLDFTTLQRLDFEAPRSKDFPALDLARAAGNAGGTMPAVFNAANEVAVDAFLARTIHFTRIWELVDRTMSAHQWATASELDHILAADHWARHFATEHLALHAQSQ